MEHDQAPASAELLNLQAALQELVDNSLETPPTIALHRRDFTTEVVIRDQHRDGGRGLGIFCRDGSDIGKALERGLSQFGNSVDIDPGLTWPDWLAGLVSIGTRWPNTGQVMKQEEGLCDLVELPESFAMSTDTQMQAFYNQQAESTMFCETEAEDHEEAPQDTKCEQAMPEGLDLKDVIANRKRELAELAEFAMLASKTALAARSDLRDAHLPQGVVPMLSLKIVKPSARVGDQEVGPEEKAFEVPMVPTTLRVAIITVSVCVAVVATAFFGAVGFVAYALIK